MHAGKRRVIAGKVSGSHFPAAEDCGSKNVCLVAFTFERRYDEIDPCWAGLEIESGAGPTLGMRLSNVAREGDANTSPGKASGVPTNMVPFPFKDFLLV
jgi:hypothetical protein